MPLGFLSAAFGVGSALAGISNARGGQRVIDAQNSFDAKVAEINAKRIARENRYAFGQQRVQGATAGNGQYGSLLFTFADDARKARERETQVFLGLASQQAARRLGAPSTAGAGINAITKGIQFGAQFGGSLGLF